jgi:hypothetical protein
MGGTRDGDSGLDEALLRLVAGRLGQLTLVERVSLFPASKPDSVVAQLDLQYFPERMNSVALELRTYQNGAFYISYREEWNGESWMCRWDRHDNPHSSRDHFHQPPEARTTDAVDREYPTDVLAVLELILDFVDQRIGDAWENEQLDE